MQEESADLQESSVTETGAVSPAAAQPDVVRVGSSDHYTQTEAPVFTPVRHWDGLVRTTGEYIKSNRRYGDRDIFRFDPRKFDAQAAKEIKDQEKWLKKTWGDNDRSRQSLVDERLDIAARRAWLEKYSGRISSRWAGSWMTVEEDVGDPDVGLWSDEISAAIDYPTWHVPFTLGQNRLLTPLQLNMLATAKTMLRKEVFEDKIAIAQLEMGLNPQAVEAAVALNRSARAKAVPPVAPTTPQT